MPPVSSDPAPGYSPIDEKEATTPTEEPITVIHTQDELPIVSGQVSKAPSVRFIYEAQEGETEAEDVLGEGKAKTNASATGNVLLPPGPPALEAILLDRKRRSQMGQGSAAPLPPGTSLPPALGVMRPKTGGAPSVKGKSFKSSPLVPSSLDPELIDSTSERNRSKDARNVSSSQNNEESGVSIPDATERTGPDIQENK